MPGVGSEMGHYHAPMARPSPARGGGPKSHPSPNAADAPSPLWPVGGACQLPEPALERIWALLTARSAGVAGMRLTCSAACRAVDAVIPAMRLPRPRLLLDLAPAIAADRFSGLRFLEVDVAGDTPAGALGAPPFLPAAAAALARLGRQLTALEFDDAGGGAEDSHGALLPFLMATAELRGLVSLKIVGPSPSPAGVAAAICAAAQLPLLEELYLSSSSDAAAVAGAALQQAFARPNVWPNLKVLELPAPTPVGLRALAAARLPALRSLRLAHGPGDGDSSDAAHPPGGRGGAWAAALTGAVWLPQLRAVELVSCGGLDRDGLAALARAPLVSLESLSLSDLSDSADFDDAARALSCAALPALRALDLGGSFEQGGGLLTPAGLDALAASPWLPQLTRLSVCRDAWAGPESWGALGALRLPRLKAVAVAIEGQGLALRAAARLAESPVIQSVSSLQLLVRCPAGGGGGDGARPPDGRAEREKLLKLPALARLGRRAEVFVLI